MVINAGALNQKVHIMELSQTETGWDWTERRKAWAKAELTGKSNIFSSVGLGARTVVFTIRRQSIDLNCSIVWNGQHCFLTSIVPTEDRVHLVVTAAMVSLVSCTARMFASTLGVGNRPVRTESGSISFQTAITEKYVGHSMGDTHAESSVTYVLVTPKAVVLSPGDQVTLEDGPAPGTYPVTCCHMVDEFKNEYEIARKADV